MNYVTVYEIIKNIMEGESIDLIECIAEKIAMKILEKLGKSIKSV